MVLFTNVCINQRVEVRWHGGIYKGVVRFKGSLSGIHGDWVGVELIEPVGEHSGMVNGRRYFQCLRNHGIFIPASHIRFIPSKRHLYDKYKAVTDGAMVEEPLFGWPVRPGGTSQDPSVIEECLADWVTSPAYPEPTYEQTVQPANFHLRHSVGHHLPAANSAPPVEPEPRMMHTVFGKRSVPFESLYGIVFNDDDDNFITSPSIPMPHMPHAALKKQVKKGWDKAHYARYMSVNTGRDSIKYSQSNDISA